MNCNNAKRASGQRPKKRKRRQYFGNQHTEVECFDVDRNISASEKKIVSDSSESAENVLAVSNSFDGYAILDKSLLFSALEGCLCCSICHNNICCTSEVVYGLMIKLNISCSSCGVISVFKNSRMVGKKQNASDLNRRFILAMRCIGKGLAECNTFCGVMDLPSPVTQKSYDKIVSHIYEATYSVAENSMRIAAGEEVQLTGSSDLTVSGDGTWKTRGHSSRFGATSIIGSETGKVIDRYVSCSYCKGCEMVKDFRTKESCLEWKREHAKICAKNHSGSSVGS